MSEDLSFLNYSQVFSDSSTKATPTPAIQTVIIDWGACFEVSISYFDKVSDNSRSKQTV